MRDARVEQSGPGALTALLIYAALSILFFGRGLLGHLADRYLGQDTDPSVFMWFLKWWPYAIAHRLDPLFTRLVWVPGGTNLAWSTAVPLPAIAAAPLTHLIGPVATYNLLCLAAPPLAAIAAFALCREITRSFRASMLGGFIFGFSPYMLAEILGHLSLVLVFPVPLALLLVLMRLDDRIGNRSFVAIFSIVVAVEFLCSVETFATASVMGGIALVLAIVLHSCADRARLLALLPPIIMAYLIVAAVVSPYLYHLFAWGGPGHPLWSAGKYSADLLNLVVPTTSNLLGTNRLARAISAKFPGYLLENGAYVSIALIAIAEAFRRNFGRTPGGKLLLAMLAIAVVAELGPMLHIFGHSGWTLPWAAVTHLPLLKVALPLRFSMFASLALAIMTAMWFASARARRSVKYGAAAAIVFFLMPNLDASYWASPIHLPRMFSDGSYRNLLSPAEVVMPIPYGQKGSLMLWQAATDMYFRMASGWTGPVPFEYDRLPIVNFLAGAHDLPEAGEHLRAFVGHFGVTAVIADTADSNLPVFRPMLGALGVAPRMEDGVLMYRVAPDRFAAYANLTGEELESRAVALRFDTVLEAVSAYLARGGNAGALSPMTLKQAQLLPADWIIEQDLTALRDFWVGPDEGVGEGAKIDIVVRGSYDAVRPLALRYRGLAAGIYYPYPEKWTDGAAATDQQLLLLWLVFDRAALRRAADELRSSPPPERTQPLWPAASCP